MDRFDTAAAKNKGTIFSDCDKTIFDLKDGTGFYEDYFIYLIAMKKSGYEVIIHSASPDVNEGRVMMYSGKLAGDRMFFEFDGVPVAHKDNDTCGMKGIVAFDDDHVSHSTQVDMKLDTNDSHVKAAIKRVADTYRSNPDATNFTFNPDDFKVPSAELQPDSGPQRAP